MKRSKEDKMRRKTFLWGIHHKAVGTQSIRCVQVSKETLSKVKGKKKKEHYSIFSVIFIAVMVDVLCKNDHFCY